MLLPLLLREAKRVEPMHFAAGEKLGSLRGARVAVRANDIADHELALEQQRRPAAAKGDDGAALPPPQCAGEDDRWFGAVVTRVDPSSLVVAEKEVVAEKDVMGVTFARRGRASAVAADERVDGYSNLFSVELEGSGAERRGVDGADLSWDLSKVGAARACVCSSALARADSASVGGERAARACLGPRPCCDASKKEVVVETSHLPTTRRALLRRHPSSHRTHTHVSTERQRV